MILALFVLIAFTVALLAWILSYRTKDRWYMDILDEAPAPADEAVPGLDISQRQEWRGEA